MPKLSFHNILLEKFSFEPTASQAKGFEKIADFLSDTSNNSLLLIKGYAGTGKTTLIGLLVRQLGQISKRSVLMAPTGRAAKVLSSYAGKNALTIHKKIYFPKADSRGTGVQFSLKENKHTHTVFIVDESSMIGDDRQQSKLFENGSLLHDLVHYVINGKNCQLIFVGDTAQLPPVNLSLSPALDENELTSQFNVEVFSVTLEDVVRQQAGSGILFNATRIRKLLIRDEVDGFNFQLDGFKDVKRIIEGNEFLELLNSALHEDGIDQTVLIVRSNKRANLYNKNIRERILYLESDLAVGDQLMVVKNNYFWLDADSQPGFIANGDVIRINRINKYIDRYDMKFAEVNVKMVDYPHEQAFDTVLLLETLKSETANLGYEQSQLLFQKTSLDYAHEKSKYKRFLKVKSDPYFNALQVKYSYAVTCHKSQGGQWKNVFVEQPYLPEGPNKDYYRWLYTAITRAKERLFLIGFGKEYF
ncbi:MAG: ATP-dependent endonuclease [Flavobacteriaceae bacterium]|nr:ATP-dependent endonuclease [Flavobacteriaceae bacterium]